MRIKTLILSSLKNLRKNLKRSVLTMLGIIIGVSAVITIVALGEGYKASIIEDFTGENEQSIVLNVSFIPEVDDFNVMESYFTERDGELLKNNKYIKSYELLDNNQVFGSFVEAEIRGNYIQGIVGTIEESNNENIVGRNITKTDNDRLNKVAVINESILPEDSDLDDYLGSIVTLENTNYEVVGIIPFVEKEGLDIFSFDNNIKVPVNTYKQINGDTTTIYGIQIVLNEGVDVEEAIINIEKILNELGSNKASGTYEVSDSTGVIDLLGSVLNTITSFIAIVAGISLFIAGIGVMNMMYTSVSERTLEIGIKRALGAKKKDIKREFLYEGIMITLSGGFIGYILGILIALIASTFLDLKVKPSLTTVVIAITVSVVVGIASSYLPAKKAANQNTVDILK